MGGFFGAVSHRDIAMDVFFGTDYHSHLGTRSAGMAVWSREKGCVREIHSIANTPFRTRFEKAAAPRIGSHSDRILFRIPRFSQNPLTFRSEVKQRLSI